MFNFQNPEIVINIAKVLGISTIAFVIAMLGAPIFIHFLYKFKLGKQIRAEGGTPVFTKLHKHKEGTPTMGGILVWGTVVFLAILFYFLSLTKINFFAQLNFLSRSQTLLPLGFLLFGAIVGILDDLMGIWRVGPRGGGLKMRHRILLYTAVAGVGAWWFYSKLGWDMIHIPTIGDFNIGWWYIPLFIFIIVATAFSANEADGLDGLAGGLMLIAYGVYAVICFAIGRIELAMFCGAIVGSLSAFLWFNIPPARFFMGDTGSMSLGVSLGVIAVITNTIFALPFIVFILVIESLSVIIQVISRRIFNKKVFLCAPLHHHFEAKGWPEYKVTMRFWIISGIMASLGLIIALIGRG